MKHGTMRTEKVDQSWNFSSILREKTINLVWNKKFFYSNSKLHIDKIIVTLKIPS